MYQRDRSGNQCLCEEGVAVEKPTQDEVNEFLDDLRESGVTNMWGAGPYIVREFGVNAKESHQLLGEWMRTFEERHGQ